MTSASLAGGWCVGCSCGWATSGAQSRAAVLKEHEHHLEDLSKSTWRLSSPEGTVLGRYASKKLALVIAGARKSRKAGEHAYIADTGHTLVLIRNDAPDPEGGTA